MVEITYLFQLLAPKRVRLNFYLDFSFPGIVDRIELLLPFPIVNYSEDPVSEAIKYSTEEVTLTLMNKWDPTHDHGSIFRRINRKVRIDPEWPGTHTAIVLPLKEEKVTEIISRAKNLKRIGIYITNDQTVTYINELLMTTSLHVTIFPTSKKQSERLSSILEILHDPTRVSLAPEGPFAWGKIRLGLDVNF